MELKRPPSASSPASAQGSLSGGYGRFWLFFFFLERKHFGRTSCLNMPGDGEQFARAEKKPVVSYEVSLEEVPLLVLSRKSFSPAEKVALLKLKCKI